MLSHTTTNGTFATNCGASTQFLLKLGLGLLNSIKARSLSQSEVRRGHARRFLRWFLANEVPVGKSMPQSDKAHCIELFSPLQL
jgi:hypothetical protein